MNKLKWKYTWALPIIFIIVIVILRLLNQTSFNECNGKVYYDAIDKCVSTFDLIQLMLLIPGALIASTMHILVQFICHLINPTFSIALLPYEDEFFSPITWALVSLSLIGFLIDRLILFTRKKTRS